MHITPQRVLDCGPGLGELNQVMGPTLTHILSLGLLNYNPSWPPNNMSKAKESICMYIKQLYWILENKLNTEH